MTETTDPLVLFMPSGKRGRFPVGTPVLDAARQLGVYVESVCGGRATCGRCQIEVQEGTARSKIWQTSKRNDIVWGDPYTPHHAKAEIPVSSSDRTSPRTAALFSSERCATCFSLILAQR